jgi:hypothetical protein
VAGVDPASPPDWPTLGESRRNSVFAPAAEARANAKTATEKAKSQAAKKVKERFSSRLAAEVGDTGRLRTLASWTMQLAGLLAILFGAYVLYNVTVGVESLEAECNAQFGECVWDAIPTKLYFKENFLAGGVCGL